MIVSTAVGWVHRVGCTQPDAGVGVDKRRSLSCPLRADGFVVQAALSLTLGLVWRNEGRYRVHCGQMGLSCRVHSARDMD